MISNKFSENSAIQGGVIFLANILSTSNFLNENIFKANKAEYGNTVASYPTRLVLEKSLSLKTTKKLNYINAYPGLSIEDFNLTVVDSFGQIMLTKNDL